MWTFKPSATPRRYFYLNATLNVSHIKWPHQMHWNTLGVFCFCHTIVLYSESCSSGRGFYLFSLTKLHHTHCLTSPKTSISFLTSPENSTSNNLTNKNRFKFRNLTKLHHIHFLTSPKTSISFLTSSENSTSNNLTNRNRFIFVNLTKLHHTHLFNLTKYHHIIFLPHQEIVHPINSLIETGINFLTSLNCNILLF